MGYTGTCADNSVRRFNQIDYVQSVVERSETPTLSCQILLVPKSENHINIKEHLCNQFNDPPQQQNTANYEECDSHNVADNHEITPFCRIGQQPTGGSIKYVRL